MNWGRIVGLGVALALASTSALGFEEQKSEAPASAPAVTAPGIGAELSGSAGVGKAEEGTEVRIPGLGKLGVLPKMDFGLELLYGANEPKVQDEERELPSDDLTIRGTVKKTF